MFRYLLVLAVCACISTSCGSNQTFVADSATRSVSSVDATNAWNSVCAQYHFIPKPQDTVTTFSRGYFGSNFQADINAITSRVNMIVQGVEMPSGGNDVMKFKIENWGPAGGGL